jgi:signal transduction histidine kinase
VARHAQATRVSVALCDLDDQVLIDVRDDGTGFEPSHARSDSLFGLASMCERLAELGGTLTVESAVGGGTAISAAAPVEVWQPAHG